MWQEEDIEGLWELVNNLAPFVDQIVEVVSQYIPALKSLADGLQDYVVQSNIKNYKAYVDAGLRTEAALALILAGQIDLKKIVDNLNK
jgi:hypothetical protein